MTAVEVGAEPATRAFRALGTSAVVAVVEPDAADTAERLLRQTLLAFDRACSRFREDSEIMAIARSEGSPVRVSGLLFDALSIALEVARLTSGAVDPTVGGCLRDLGYDRDFGLLVASSADPKARGASVTSDNPAAPDRHRSTSPAPGWWTVELDPDLRTVRVPRGTLLDLGSCAKAFAADASASLIASVTGSGTVVSLGGDVAAAGTPPADGWKVAIAESFDAPFDRAQARVVLEHGGLASSSPGVRTWGPNGTRHHIVDPRTGDCALAHWDLVSALAPTCVEANAVTTAALVWGAGAVKKLLELGYPVRLSARDGEPVLLNGWSDAGPDLPTRLGPAATMGRAVG